jgi:hypothetical protein
MSSSPVDLSEIFSKAPDQLTESEINAVIAELRTARDSWETEKVAAQRSGKRSPRPSAGISAKAVQKNAALDELLNDPALKSLMEDL